MAISISPYGLRAVRMLPRFTFDYCEMVRYLCQVPNVSSQIPRPPSARFRFLSHYIYQDSPSTTSWCVSWFTALCFRRGSGYEHQRKPFRVCWVLLIFLFRRLGHHQATCQHVCCFRWVLFETAPFDNQTFQCIGDWAGLVIISTLIRAQLSLIPLLRSPESPGFLTPPFDCATPSSRSLAALADVLETHALCACCLTLAPPAMSTCHLSLACFRLLMVSCLSRYEGLGDVVATSETTILTSSLP